MFAAEYLVLAFTAFLIALIWGAIGYQIDHDRKALLDTAQVSTRNLARAYAEHVEGTLQLLDQVLQRVKYDFENQSSDPAFLRRVMSDAQIEAQIVPMGVVDRNGYIIASNLGAVSQKKSPTAVPSAAVFAGDRDYFHAQMARDAGIYVSAPIVSRVTGKTTIALSRRLNDAHGTFAGVVFASFDLDYLTGFFSDLAIGKNSSFSILGHDLVIRDMIRGTGRADDLVGKSVPKPGLVPALTRAPNGDYEAVSPVDGLDRFFSYRSLPKYQLIVLASAARPDILADFNERKYAMIGTGVLLTLIFITVATFQLRRIARTRRYEIALNRSNEKLARAQRLATIGCFEHNVTTGVADWSDELYRILGLDPTDAPPGHETLIGLIHPEDRERFQRHRDAELAGKATEPLEYRVVRADGTERVVRRESAVVFDKDTKGMRRYGTLHDITQRFARRARERELERQLLHSQKLEALGTLAGGIAHDLNNTLVPIMALSKLTARRFNNGHDLRNNLDTIFAASEQARDLVRRVLAFSRRRPEQQKVNRRPGRRRLEAMKLMRATVPTSIQLVPRSTKSRDPRRSSQIHQVITNLVTTPRGDESGNAGTITVVLGAPSRRSRERNSPLGRRYRQGHGREHVPPHLRALLHHQGSRSGNRARPVDHRRHRHQSWRPYRGHERARQGHTLRRLFPDRRCPGRNLRRGLSSRAGDEENAAGRDPVQTLPQRLAIVV